MNFMTVCKALGPGPHVGLPRMEFDKSLAGMLRAGRQGRGRPQDAAAPAGHRASSSRRRRRCGALMCRNTGIYWIRLCMYVYLSVMVGTMYL
ncbi:hypothetical protein PF005_g28654, partial [Phytophthora fragariae]